MNEDDAFLRAICANPDDDTPRLAFADWLQEHAEEARAEFIRAQVRFADLLRHGAPDTDGLARRARELWLLYGQEWCWALPHVAGVTWHDAFFRGFVERATVASDTVLVQNADAVFGQPLRQLVVASFEGVKGFSELSGLARLKTLMLANQLATPGAVNELLRCNQLSESVLLFCNFVQISAPLARQLRTKFGARLQTRTDPPTGR
jgi:uncharacterized protein (TIGR02996 family)